MSITRRASNCSLMKVSQSRRKIPSFDAISEAEPAPDDVFLLLTFSWSSFSVSFSSSFGGTASSFEYSRRNVCRIWEALLLCARQGGLPRFPELSEMFRHGSISRGCFSCLLKPKPEQARRTIHKHVCVGSACLQAAFLCLSHDRRKACKDARTQRYNAHMNARTQPWTH